MFVMSSKSFPAYYKLRAIQFLQFHLKCGAVGWTSLLLLNPTYEQAFGAFTQYGMKKVEQSVARHDTQKYLIGKEIRTKPSTHATIILQACAINFMCFLHTATVRLKTKCIIYIALIV